VSLGVLCMFYAFAAVITKKKIWKYVITIIMAALVVFIYWEINKPKVVQMKEDVLYIKPKAKL
jgi:hypothetical protein